jgi:aryl-alcohol dehydrogenase-like predicted oxidoreductase
VYVLGHSEEVVGKALRQMSERPLIATKGGREWDAKGEIRSNLRRESIRAEIDASLRRLQVDVIDLYQLHWPEPDELIEEGWETIAGAVTEGKIRLAGVCNFNVSQLRRIRSIHPVASLQVPYSLLRRDIESETLDFCAKNNIGVVVYSPMQKGLLMGRLTKEIIQNLPEDDHRRRDPMFQDPRLSAILKMVEGLRPIARRRGRSVGELAIAWCLRRSEITSAIVGARRPTQIEETAPGGEWELTPEDAEAIENVFRRQL